MGEFSIWHWMVVLLVVLLLFGGGKVSGLMGDLAKGIKAFKQNMAEDPKPVRVAEIEPPAETVSVPAGEAPRPAPAREAAVRPRETTPAH